MLPQHYTSGVIIITCELVVLPSWHWFRNPDALDPCLCLVSNVRKWLRKTLEELLQDTARKYGCEYCLTNISRACNFFYHRCVKCALSYSEYISRAEEVMREYDIHHTRSIKTNSGVSLSRKPGLDLCCDLLQHLQGVPRTCSFWVFTSYTYIDFARLITQIVLHMKCNQIQLSYYFVEAVFAQFCFILFNM